MHKFILYPLNRNSTIKSIDAIATGISKVVPKTRIRRYTILPPNSYTIIYNKYIFILSDRISDRIGPTLINLLWLYFISSTIILEMSYVGNLQSLDYRFLQNNLWIFKIIWFLPGSLLKANHWANWYSYNVFIVSGMGRSQVQMGPGRVRWSKGTIRAVRTYLVTGYRFIQ